MVLPDTEENPETTKRNISFIVNDGNTAVQGACVAIGSVQNRTGSAGGCTLQNIEDGEQTVTVTCDGYEDYTDTITVSENSNSFTISLTAVETTS